jgi:ubiquinone/menaquinone biosynthesis C-methylase UbiE
MKKLNLGCGRDIRQGYVNLDSVKMPGVDVVHNLDKYPYPFKDSTFDEVYAAHVLEHLDDLVKALKELRRVTKPNGTITIRVPFFPSMYAASDPTHKHFFTYLTWDYLTDITHNHVFGDIKKPYFSIVSRKIVFSWNPMLQWMNHFINASPVFYQRFLAFILPSNELVVKLKVLK